MRYQRKEFGNKLKEKVFLNYKGKCADCGMPGKGSWFINKTFLPSQRKKSFLINGLEIHHIVWVVNGGNNDQDNLILLCQGCHKARHAV